LHVLKGYDAKKINYRVSTVGMAFSQSELSY